MTQRADEQEERQDRSERDHPAGEQPDRHVVRRGRWPRSDVRRRQLCAPRTTTTARATAQNDRREQEAPGEQRAPGRERRPTCSASEDVRARTRTCRRARTIMPAVESDVPPPNTSTIRPRRISAQRERDPDPPPHVLVVGEARPERDEQRREVLDQQRDVDREPVNREAVEALGRARGRRSPNVGDVRQLAARQAQPSPDAVDAPGSSRARRRAPSERTCASRSDESPVGEDRLRDGRR